MTIIYKLKGLSKVLRFKTRANQAVNMWVLNVQCLIDIHERYNEWKCHLFFVSFVTKINWIFLRWRPFERNCCKPKNINKFYKIKATFIPNTCIVITHYCIFNRLIFVSSDFSHNITIWKQVVYHLVSLDRAP